MYVFHWYILHPTATIFKIYYNLLLFFITICFNTLSPFASGQHLQQCDNIQDEVLCHYAVTQGNHCLTNEKKNNNNFNDSKQRWFVINKLSNEMNVNRR